VLDGPHHAAALVRAGITDFRQKYAIPDFVRGDVLFAAPGITDGALLPGVRVSASEIRTETLVTRSSTRLRRLIQSSHGIDQAAKD
ncbi:fructose-bisphosphatase class II, partial [Acinetobacter baumannii]